MTVGVDATRGVSESMVGGKYGSVRSAMMSIISESVSSILWTRRIKRACCVTSWAAASGSFRKYSSHSRSPLVIDSEPPRISISSNALCVTLGLYRNRSVGRIRGNQATFDNSQRNNLRSCMWVLGVVLVRMFVFSSSLLSVGARTHPLC